jgi:hypothetical protein
LGDLLATILAPLHETQTKQSQALLISSQQLQRLADVLQGEPSRQAMLDAIRTSLNVHTTELTTLVQRHIDALTTAIAQHNQDCERRVSLTTERDVSREDSSFIKIRDEVTAATKPARDLTEQWDRLKWEVRLAYVSCIGLAGYIIWLYHHLLSLPIPPK